MGKTYTIAPRVEFTPLPTGEYVARLMHWQEKVEERDTQFSRKGDVQIEFHWEVEVPGAEAEERRDWASIPRTWAKKSKFVQIALALGLARDGQAAEEGAVIDWDDGLGKRCKVTIVRSIKEGTNDWTDKITGYMRLDQLPTVPQRRTAPAAPAHDDDDDIPF